MSQRARDGGAANVHGWTVCRKEPGMAVRRMSMDGRYVAKSQGWRCGYNLNAPPPFEADLFWTLEKLKNICPQMNANERGYLKKQTIHRLVGRAHCPPLL